MTDPLIERLKAVEDARHREVYRVLDCIDEQVRAIEDARRRLAEQSRDDFPRPAPRSIRDRVLRELAGGERTVAQIAAATGLRNRQIRGVLYAKDLQESVIRSTERDGVMCYSLVEADEAANG